MKKDFLIVISLLFYSSFSFAQVEEKEIIVGKSFTIQSKILEDQREIQVYLPENYYESNNEYPVLYILDGQRYFLHGISLQKSFLNFRQTAAFIIVGLTRKRSDRNNIYSRLSEDYLSFIEEEVISFIDNRFRTSKERLLFGWAYGGGFVIETLMKKPHLFTAYIAASPFPVENKINTLESLLSENAIKNKTLFFASETDDGGVKKGVTQLSALLEAKAPKELSWTYKDLSAEEHRSTAFSTLYHGIQQYYHYFPELQFSNLTEFRKVGGLPYVYEYYKKRAEAFGFPPQIADWTMFSLARNAIRDNDIEQFDIFINEFKLSGFLERINLNRSISIANFFLENGKYNQALDLFKLLAETHTTSDKPLRGLGDTYKAMGEEEKAIIYYKKADDFNQD